MASVLNINPKKTHARTGKRRRRKGRQQRKSRKLLTKEAEKRIAAEYFDPERAGAFSGRSTYQRHTKQTPSQVRDFLNARESYTLHKPVRRTFPRRITYARRPDELWQADLADMGQLHKENRGTRFLLTVIDVFSKFAWVRPLKRKTSDELVRAFTSILKESEGRKPKHLQTDKGTEFKNRPFQELLRREGIHFYTSQDPVTKAAIVERFNRTIKGRIYRYMTHKNSRSYLDALQPLVKNYNASFHRSIGTQPRLVGKKNYHDVYWRLYGKAFRDRMTKRKTPKFAVGDHVRIAVERKTFQRGFLPGWTQEIFIVRQMENTHPYVYRLQDQRGENILGTFYEQEMQKVKQGDKDTVYRIERVLKKRGRQALVRWAGYGPDFDSWIPLSSLQTDFLN